MNWDYDAARGQAARTGHRTGRRNIREQFANEEFAWPRKSVVNSRPWKERRISLDSFLAATRFMRNYRTLPGNCLDDSSDVARTPSRTPRGLFRVCQPICFVICGVDFIGNCHVTCEPLRKPWCGHSPALCETLPANCSDTGRKLPGWLIGCCADDSADTAPDAMPDAAWTATAKAKSSANHRANFGANIHRRLVGRFPPTARTRLGSCPAIPRMIHRTLRRTPRRMLRGNYAATD